MSHIRARKTLNQQPLEAHLDFAKLGKGAEIPKDSVMNLGKLKKISFLLLNMVYIILKF